MNFYVYEWYIVETNEIIYVGKGKGDRYKSLRSRNKFFLGMYNTHNCKSRIVYDNLSEKEAFDKEKELINYYKIHTANRLTNMTDGGEGCSGWKPSEEFKKKQSKIQKEKWENEEFRKHMINIRNSPNSVYKSDQFRKKISESVKGEKNPNYNNHWNKQQKENLSRIRKEKGLAKGIKNPKATKIICLETGEVFNTMQEAQLKYNVKSETSFSIALKERQRTASKLHWLKYSPELLNPNFRFLELLKSLSMSEKNPIVCYETKEIFYNKKQFLKAKNIGVRFFENNYDNGIILNSYKYLYVKDYFKSLI